MPYLLGVPGADGGAVNWGEAVPVRPGLRPQPARLLRLLHDHWRSTRTWPSLDVLAAEMGVRNKSTVRYHLRTLEDLGYVRRVSHRALQLLDVGVSYPTDPPTTGATSVSA